jgi:hypothetical protein
MHQAAAVVKPVVASRSLGVICNSMLLDWMQQVMQAVEPSM